MDVNNVLGNSLIKRGSVFISTFPNIPHQKFFVVIGENKNNLVGYFFINSNIHPSVQNELGLQAILKGTDYKFLKHDSFVGCNKLSYFPKENLLSQIDKKIASYKGELQEDDLDRILEAVRNSDTYSRIDKETFFK